LLRCTSPLLAQGGHMAIANSYFSTIRLGTRGMWPNWYSHWNSKTFCTGPICLKSFGQYFIWVSRRGCWIRFLV